MIIDDSTNNDLLFKHPRGLVPRDYNVHPVDMFAPPSEIPLIPRSEWSDRIKEMERTKSRISDILLHRKIPCTDQNGHGYCWAYSTGGCVIALRALQNQPYIPLNPHSVAAIIKNGRDEGGWCGLSAEFLTKHGIAPEANWPKNSRDVRRYDTPETRNIMAKFKVTEDWVDLTRSVYDRNLTFDQVMSCLLMRIPCALDFNWWGHSVMGCDPVELDGEFCIRIRNSWTESWGDKGFGVLRGGKQIPNGAVALRVVHVASA